MTPIETIKDWFRTGKKPTQNQFWAWIDSIRFKADKVPAADVDGLQELLDEKADAEALGNHITDPNAHADQFAAVGEQIEALAEGQQEIVVALDGKAPADHQHTIDEVTGLQDELDGKSAHGHIHEVSDISGLGSALEGKAPVSHSHTIAQVSGLTSALTEHDNKIEELSNEKLDIDAKDTANGYLGLDGTGNADGSRVKYNPAAVGPLPSNKVALIGDDGKIRNYTQPMAQAPYLGELIPDSYLPSNTGNFILRGAFFTPTMTVAIEGQTVNFKEFRNSHEVLVNATTGSAEGTFDVTLDNGISKTFPDRLLIALGTVLKPVTADYAIMPVGLTADEEGTIKQVASLTGTMTRVAEGLELIPDGADFRITYALQQSPMGYSDWDRTAGVILKNATTDAPLWRTMYHYSGHNALLCLDAANGFDYTNSIGTFIHTAPVGSTPGDLITIQRVAGVVTFRRPNGTTIATSTTVYTGAVKVDFRVVNADFVNVKVILLD